MQEYSFNRIQLILMFGLGMVGLLLYANSLAKGSASGFFFCIPLVIAAMCAGFKPIRIFTTHIEFKANPFVGLDVIRYSDISKVERKSDKVLIIHKKDAGKVKIPLSLIDVNERDSVEKYIEEKMKNS